MDCPVCKDPMIIMELAHVEIDHCLTCRGVWLDAGELQELLGTAEHVTALLDSLRPDRETTEKPRRCPISRKRMEKVRSRTSGRIADSTTSTAGPAGSAASASCSMLSGSSGASSISIVGIPMVPAIRSA